MSKEKFKEKTKEKYKLIVTAHPDDETLFMGGLLLTERKFPWKVICITDGNADGDGERRFRQFSQACRSLGVKEYTMWDFTDRWEERLPTQKIIERLKALSLPQEVYTHGIIGEYGHPHHQDVSWAVHQAFNKKCKVWSVAYNCFPEKLVKLSKKAYQKKAQVLTETYKTETQRFSHLIPITFVEGFCRLKISEVNALYDYACKQILPKKGLVRSYKDYWEHFKNRFSGLPPRIF